MLKECSFFTQSLFLQVATATTKSQGMPLDAQFCRPYWSGTSHSTIAGGARAYYNGQKLLKKLSGPSYASEIAMRLHTEVQCKSCFNSLKLDFKPRNEK